MWAILMLSFEFGLGIFVLNYSWERMFEDYDVSRGGLMGYRCARAFVRLARFSLAEFRFRF
ncbi:MAG: hypothetical protein M3Q33_04865 [Acidobacteriota bacterium]|nr:hypothetical protein [Acidobacteriota bacterium]